MKYIVLITDGIYKHSFEVFATKKEAETFANKIATKHKYVEVNELVNNLYI